MSGLVTGGDLIDQLKDKDLGDKLFIPSSMLRFENDIFLDDVSVEDVERELNISLGIVNIYIVRQHIDFPQQSSKIH